MVRHVNTEQPVNLDKERRLNKAVVNLAKEAIPIQELWPNIKRKLEHVSSIDGPKENNKKEFETKLLDSRWKNWSIAASLALCISSLSFSWHQLDKAEAIYAKIEQREVYTEMGRVAAVNHAHFNDYDENQFVQVVHVRQMESMEREFKVAKAGLMARISMQQSHISKALIKQIQTELLEVETASIVLKKAMVNQAFDADIANLLRVTYQQELTVLVQLARLDSTI